ncbi:MAG: HDOD domain-containing protein [Candidatus Dadabacteria bacterium]|nr:MAG: HDOD domain-containing protein [Candidatus Dadabacteria bacterium]
MNDRIDSGLINTAAERLDSAWFPINTDLLESIQKGIKDGRYTSEEELLSEIKQDVSLYLLCVKKLIDLLQADPDNNEATKFSPPEVFKRAGFDTLKEVLLSDLESASHHKFSNITKAQSARLKEAIVSASSTEVLSTDAGVDPELGYSCALLRQLGITLIAWNYPHVYLKALKAHKNNNKDLSIELKKILGFTPTELAIRIAKRWKLSEEVNQVLDDTKSEPETPAFRTVVKLCKIGEALARSNNPEYHPSALDDWAFAESKIKDILGEGGIKIIQEKIQEHLNAYLSSAPETFGFEALENQKQKIENSNYTYQLLKENVYIDQLPLKLKILLTELYGSFSKHDISRESIDKLTSEIIPAAGFDRGAIYMIEPDSLNLVPLLKIGDMPIEGLSSINISALNLDSNPIITAFKCSSPIMQYRDEDNDIPRTTFSASLGTHQKAGVLHLEMKHDVLKQLKYDPTICFQAIRIALNHVLGLR